MNSMWMTTEFEPILAEDHRSLNSFATIRFQNELTSTKYVRIADSITRQLGIDDAIGTTYHCNNIYTH